VTTVLRRGLTLARTYPSIAVSILIILLLIGMSLYAIIALPLSETIVVWSGRDNAWRYSPRYALPAWTNLFRRDDLPRTIIVELGSSEVVREQLNETTLRETRVLTFAYPYRTFPSEITMFYDTRFATRRPVLTLTWIGPDGSEVQLFNGAPSAGESRLRIDPARALAASSALGGQAGRGADRVAEAQAGTHTLRVEATVFEEEGFSLDGRLVIYGRVHGIAGTDDQRRDLALGLLWGTPIALMFGLIAATATTVLGFVIAAIGAWLGGWVDAGIQRITEVSMMIPFLPVILMVGWFYSASIWVLLAFIIGFSIFSGPLKSNRAMFLQVKNTHYIEAAQAYGASNGRIIFRYLIPHVSPVLLPRLILGVPLFVFLEASLSYLGISDPQLPTWGKILSEAQNALYMGYYHWVLGPAFLLLLTGLSFSLLGYTLDRILNPRLRSR